MGLQAMLLLLYQLPG